MGRGDPSMPARAVLGKPVPPDEKKVSPGRVAPTCAAHVVARHPLKRTGESLPVPRSLRGGRGTHPFGVRSPRGTPKTIAAGAVLSWSKHRGVVSVHACPEPLD